MWLAIARLVANMRKRLPGLLWAAVISTLAVACGSEEQTGPIEKSRPVTVTTLERISPALSGRIAGIAQPHREEQVGFEVSGRVSIVVEVGRELAGPSLDEQQRIVQRGEVIGRIDSTRYEQALEVVERSLDAARSGLRAQEIDLATVAPADVAQAEAKEAEARDRVASAEAKQKLAGFQLSRTQELFDGGNASQKDLDQRQAQFDEADGALSAAKNEALAAAAAVAKAEASIELAKANIQTTKAEIGKLEEQRTQAVQNLDDCTLYAPFSGRVTQKHVGRGGYLNAGRAAVTLTMMDPIKVTAAVSPERSRDLMQGALVAVYPKDLDRFATEDLYGRVYDKPEVADARTRTYLIDVIVRNLRRRPFVLDAGGAKVHAVDRILPVVRKEQVEDGPLFVPAPCVLTESGRDVVYRIPGMRLRGSRAIAGVLKPEVVPVQTEDELFTVINWIFRRVADGSGLVDGDLLIVDPKPEYLEGVAVAWHDWAIRPGDIVPMSFDVGSAPEGFYAPTEAIRTSNGQASVFVVGADERAKRVAVTVHETVGVNRRIEGAELANGTRIVVEGVHYTADGEKVRVVSELGQ